MDLEKVTAKIRPRKHWEAIDLGIVLTQQHAKSLYLIWFIVTLPVYLIASLVFYDNAFWVILGFWFLLPLWERPLLHFLSRELFGETLSIKECVKAFFSLAKIQWFSSLTWRRPSFTRSLDLPIIQLEGLRGAQRSARLKVIHSVGSGPAVWLTLLFILTETVFYFAFLALAYLLLPAPIAESIDLGEWMTVESDSFLVTFILNTISYLAISFVSPFYIACGFSIYLNQRTHLEAWDIELAFKRLAQKLKTKSESQTTRLASLGLAFLMSASLCFTPGNNAYAQDASEPTEQVSASKSDIESKSENLSQSEKEEQTPHLLAKKQIKEILNGEDFNYQTQETRYVPRFEKDKKNEPLFERREPGVWYYLGKIISFIVEFALWVFLALLIIFLVIKYRHLITGIRLPEKQARQKPKKLFGLDMQSESLPANPWKVALEHCESGEIRKGVSLLLRASIIWYIDNTGVLIREGDTELECLRKLKPHGQKNQFAYMTELTNTWRGIAYAHSDPEITQLIQLCQTWPQVIALSSENLTENEGNSTSMNEGEK